MKSKIEIKIVKETNPLGVVKYLAMTRKKYLSILPGIWYSIVYYDYTCVIDINSLEYCYMRYNTLKEANNAVDKYLKWIEGSYKSETITHKYLKWIDESFKSETIKSA